MVVDECVHGGESQCLEPGLCLSVGYLDDAGPGRLAGFWVGAVPATFLPRAAISAISCGAAAAKRVLGPVHPWLGARAAVSVGGPLPAVTAHLDP